MRFFRDIKALFSGDVVWRSGNIGSASSSRYEIIVKQHSGDDFMIVFKTISGGAQYNYSTLLPDDARALGDALVAGADKCR